jgi:hypothetical protein
MSQSDLLKAELKAHRSARELENSLDHLGRKFEQIRHPGQALRFRFGGLPEPMRLLLLGAASGALTLSTLFLVQRKGSAVVDRF